MFGMMEDDGEMDPQSGDGSMSKRAVCRAPRGCAYPILSAQAVPTSTGSTDRKSVIVVEHERYVVTGPCLVRIVKQVN
jgi:hypothetical protein